MVGRDSVLQGFESRLDSGVAGGAGRTYVLVGPRGNGKTVLCAVMERMARERGARVVALDAGCIGEAGGIKEALAKATLSERLGLPARRGDPCGRPHRHWRVVGRGTGQARPLRSFGAKVLGQIGVDVRLGEKRSGGLAEVLSALAKAHGLLLTIDEAHVLDPGDGFALLNAAKQVGGSERLLVVLAGTPGLERRMATWDATFHERFQFVRVGSLQDADIRRGLVEPLAGKAPPTVFDDDALDEVVADCAGFPFFLQEWGAVIEQSGAERVGVAEVEQIGEGVLSAREQYYGRRWDEMYRAGIVGAAEELVRGGIADGPLSMRAVDDRLVAYVRRLGYEADGRSTPKRRWSMSDSSGTSRATGWNTRPRCRRWRHSCSPGRMRTASLSSRKSSCADSATGNRGRGDASHHLVRCRRVRVWPLLNTTT